MEEFQVAFLKYKFFGVFLCLSLKKFPNSLTPGLKKLPRFNSQRAAGPARGMFWRN